MRKMVLRQRSVAGVCLITRKKKRQSLMFAVFFLQRIFQSSPVTPVTQTEWAGL